MILKRTLTIAMMAAFAVALNANSSMAANVAVGAAACMSSLPHYATVQAGINAAGNGGTVNVCPGIYPEQITINQPVTVKGVTFGTAASSTISIPSGGLVANVNTASGLQTAHVLVTDTINVKLIGLTIEGAGVTCVPGTSRTVGLKIFQTGQLNNSYEETKVQNLLVRHYNDGCGNGAGIDVEKSYVTLDANRVHDADEDCITEIGGQAKITNNSVQGCFLGGIAVNGANGSQVTGNDMSFHQYGIRVDNSKNMNISNNTAGPQIGQGVLIVGGTDTLVLNNKITATFSGVWLSATTRALVTYNTIIASSYGFYDQSSLGQNYFIVNKVNEAPFGIYLENSANDVNNLYLNTFFNVDQTIRQ